MAHDLLTKKRTARDWSCGITTNPWVEDGRRRARAEASRASAWPSNWNWNDMGFFRRLLLVSGLGMMTINSAQAGWAIGKAATARSDASRDDRIKEATVHALTAVPFAAVGLGALLFPYRKVP